MSNPSFPIVQLDDSKIINEALEINVVHHCNLRCKSCSHASPHLKKYYSDPLSIYNDLKVLSSCYKPDHIRLVGGEPLLHPNLLGILDAIKKSGISEKIRLLTNGTLLSRVSESIWAELDEIHISVYPGFELSEYVTQKIINLAKKHCVTVKLMYFDKFRESYSRIGREDKLLTQRIYATCQIAHSWRCHTVYEGFFYKCPQSLFVLGAINQNADELKIKISERSSLRDELISFIQSDKPLMSCKFCYGSAGTLFAHQQEPRTLQGIENIQNGVDTEFLMTLEKDLDAENGCCTSEVFLYCP